MRLGIGSASPRLLKSRTSCVRIRYILFRSRAAGGVALFEGAGSQAWAAGRGSARSCRQSIPPARAPFCLTRTLTSSRVFFAQFFAKSTNEAALGRGKRLGVRACQQFQRPIFDYAG